MFGLPRAVWLLGWVSLATDAATESIYPLLPFFLTTVLGAGAVSLGIIEGAAEAVNSLLKILSGRRADKSRSKRPLVLLGYSVSSSAKPFIALATGPVQVFVIRVLDRLGKGVRGSPRDAMLASWATPATRGRVYGVHQAMDNLGAVIGPALATLFLLAYPGRYRTLFALTIIPGAISVLLILLIPERRDDRSDAKANATGSAASGFDGSDSLPPTFTRFMVILTIFALGNSSDAFLLLRLTEAAGSAKFVPLMWAGIHVVKSAVSFVSGGWSDRIGRRTVITIGWIVYAVVYAGFAMSTTLTALLSWFIVYGFYFGFAEGTEKALVADLAPASRRGTAFGIYNAVVGVGALLASVVFGLLWMWMGAAVAFGTGAALAFVATAMLFVAL
ncbi:MAG TPA: MFS transporter [Vicinamibacterales bacterium]|nr:MFS transporter [Vicinamibacterales bacterium]